VDFVATRRDAVFLVVAACVCLGIGSLLPAEVEALSPTKLILLPIGLALVSWTAWLSVARPLAALALGFALLGVVLVEPAPVDLVLAMLIAASYAVGHVVPRIPLVVGLPLALFALLTLVSMLNADKMSAAVRFELITLYMLVLAVWLSWAFANPRWVSVAMRTYVVVAIASAALAPIALYLPIPGALKSVLIYGGVRAKGLFKDPNVYSPFLVPAALILLEELSRPRLLAWRRKVVALSFLVVTVGVVIAYSRAGWLNYVIGVATLVCVQAARRGGLRLAVRSTSLLVGCGVLGLALLSATGSLAFLQERSHLQSYDQQRFANQSVAVSDLTRHVFGYGPGQSEIRLPLATHETFARSAFEQGLLGLASLSLVFLGTLYCAFVLARRRKDVHGVGTAALLGIWLGQTVNGFFVDTLHWRHLWVFAALIWCGYGLGADRGRPRRSVARAV
jgi:hypothetical protein